MTQAEAAAAKAGAKRYAEEMASDPAVLEAVADHEERVVSDRPYEDAQPAEDFVAGLRSRAGH
ncbi:MAG: hypothetical protein M3450_07930 [Actinomycetota bacterium]|nr:hypothetical protein [Actinomycetota bacterium]